MFVKFSIGLFISFLAFGCQAVKQEQGSSALYDEPRPEAEVDSQDTNEPVDQRFAPDGNVREGILSALSKATKTVDAAVYSFGDKEVIDKLMELGRSGIKIRLLLNKPTGKCKILKPGQPKANNRCDQLEDAGIDVRYVTPVMHHKFGIVDGGQSRTFDNVTVMTGSANWSSSAFSVFDEDWVRYDGDSALARAFQNEFNYIWDHSKDYPGVTTGDPSIAVELKEGANAFFTSTNTTKNKSPGSYKWNKEGSAVSSQVVEEIDKASTSIKVGHAHFRTPSIYEAIKRAHVRGVKVQIVLDQQEFRPGSQFGGGNLFFEEDLANQGVDVRYKVYSVRWSHFTAKQMHSKYTIIDDSKVLTGSYNWSPNAETNTFENMVIITKPEIVKKYIDHHEKISSFRAGEFEALKAKLSQGAAVDDCHMTPMTMTPDQFIEWRSLFLNNICK
jgi:phosphatidylserine/phosphatidylglycerophosphate/cardiolipin synthase-like enzyme